MQGTQFRTNIRQAEKGCYLPVGRIKHNNEVLHNDDDMGFGWRCMSFFSQNGKDDDQILPRKKRHWIKRYWRRFVVATEDWIYLALLGCIMALVSLAVDNAGDRLTYLSSLAFDWASGYSPSILWAYLEWVLWCVTFVMLSALITHYVAPQAIGSGIPEMKTVLRGVVLKEYLTMRTMIAKVLSLTLALGTGLPLGREGPFVHMASMVASQLSRLVHGFKRIYENESRNSEMLAASCAVGVACTFSAPIGGVLFSIEVTSVFFAVRNYWRGFFAAGCSAIFIRVLQTLFKDPNLAMNAFYQTSFPASCFVPQELPIFALIGLVCGLLGSLFILLNRHLVLFLRHNWIARMVFQRYWPLYPLLVAIVASSVTFPHSLGQFMSGRQSISKSVPDLFANCTWTSLGESACAPSVIDHWNGIDQPHSVFISLVTFHVVYFAITLLSSTLPISAGIFMPMFILGAVFGRTAGEVLATIFPDGINGGSILIFPGVYAVAGAAALAGAVTHTVSVAVIVFELTGQLFYLLPVMIAVIVANGVCSYFQPSIYDSIIRLKHLPYLPDIRHTSSAFHEITIDRVMLSSVLYLPRDASYGYLRDLLSAHPRPRAFPVVDSKDSKILVGSICRQRLAKLLDDQIGTVARQKAARARGRAAFWQTIESTIVHPFVDHSIIDAGRRERNKFTIIPVKDQRGELRPRSASEEKQEDASLGVRSLTRSNSGVSGKYRPDGSDHTFHSVTDFLRSLGPKKSTGEEYRYDFDEEEKAAWESVRLQERIRLDDVSVDSSPFHVPAHTTLFKVHSLFSLLGLNRAYLTEKGVLVGVVALKELRYAIERVQSGSLSPCDEGDESVDGEASPDDDDNSDYDDVLHPRIEIVSAPSFSRSSKMTSMDVLRMMARKESIRMDSMTTSQQNGSDWRGRTTEEAEILPQVKKPETVIDIPELVIQSPSQRTSFSSDCDENEVRRHVTIVVPEDDE